jgi:hypothetical protein
MPYLPLVFVFFSALSALASSAPAAVPTAAEQKSALDDALHRGESLWQQVATAEPRPTSGCRGLIGYALVLCEARIHPERLQRLFTLVRQMQDQDPKGKYWGNLKWYWRDAGVTDTNAVEFCMQDALLIYIRHGDWLPLGAKKELLALLRLGVEGCLRHRVPTEYTNIAILNAGNLIVLGEQFDRTDTVQEGRRRLDALCELSATFGIHEFCSPTYYGTDLNGLLLIHTYAKLPREQRQAEALLRLLWTDIAANWFPPAKRLGGCQSRSYDYLRGIGGLDWHLWTHGWLESKAAGSAERREPWTDEWSPPAALLEMARGQLPRSVRQRFGILPAQCRSQVLYDDIALSCCGACYGNQDSTLAVDLPGGREQPRCYFIPDGREDPYGKKKYETGSAKHLKALHMQPFWAGTQSGCDALGLVVYRANDLSSPEVTHVQSHFVLRRPDAIWLDGKRVTMPKGTAEKPAVLRVPDHLVLRYGSAVVGLCAGSFREDDPRDAKLVDDGNAWNCLRLTIDHGLRSDLMKDSASGAIAGAAFWVRVGSGLKSDADFDAWRVEFENHFLSTGRDDARETFSARLTPAVGNKAQLSIEARAPGSPAACVRLLPPPYQGVLEVDGKEVGIPLLSAVEPLSSYPPGTGPLCRMTVPAGKAFYWEAESGLILPGMTVEHDAQASGQSCIGQESSAIAQPSGSAIWSLTIEKAGRYWLWARVRSAEAGRPRAGAFSVQAMGETGAVMPAAKWIPRAGSDWQWKPLTVEGAKSPTALNLPNGLCRLQIQTQQSGTRIDRLMLTVDSSERP